MHRCLVTLALCATLLAVPGVHAAAPPPYSPEFARVLGAPADATGYLVRLEQARAALLAKEWKNAEVLFGQLVADYPLDRETWVGLGSAQRELGKSEALIASYRKSITLIGPVPGSSRYWIAVQQARLG